MTHIVYVRMYICFRSEEHNKKSESAKTLEHFVSDPNRSFGFCFPSKLLIYIGGRQVYKDSVYMYIYLEISHTDRYTF